ncbi:MAG: transcriptional repressor [Bacteroidaceae bacterium]|jgi:Fur family ferric uptake transcriptional regulator|nr:transcriptional repressor [Bacteroidaceae bacterium]MCR5043390.1 transcriptional repressor [Bacteroidaceae bacterium]MDO4201895.1 transcriptional repressor [Bacteroidales bacterium]
MNDELEHLLEHHGIRPTAVRILVYRAIHHRSEAFSLADVENWLPEMDRSSIFRALKLFTEHQLLHEIDDGSGIFKYCVCRCEGSHHLNHIHFACTRCGKTYCLEDHTIPLVSLPDGFETHEVEYIVKGVCPRCK